MVLSDCLMWLNVCLFLAGTKINRFSKSFLFACNDFKAKFGFAKFTTECKQFLNLLFAHVNSASVISVVFSRVDHLLVKREDGFTEPCEAQSGRSEE